MGKSIPRVPGMPAKRQCCVGGDGLQRCEGRQKWRQKHENVMETYEKVC